MKTTYTAIYDKKRERGWLKMFKMFVSIVLLVFLFAGAFPLDVLAQDGRRVRVDTSRWERRLVQVEEARPARFENRTVVVSPARTETRIIPEVRETRTRWVPPVIETRFVMIEPGRPAVPEQGHRASRTIPAVTRTDRVWILPVTGNRTVSYERTPGRFEDRIVVVTPERTERHWVVTRAARTAQYTWMDVVITPGRTERRWIPPVTREERFWDAEIITHWERVRVSDGWWGVELRERRTGNLIVRIPFPVWNPPVYRMEQRVNTRHFLNTRTVVVTPGRHETVRIPPVTERRRVQTSPAVSEQGHWASRTIPAVTRTDRVWIPRVMGTRTETYTRVPGRYEDRTVVVSPAQTESYWVVTRAAQPAVPEQWDFRDFVVAPGRNETYSVVVAPATTAVEHIPAVTRIESVLVEAAQPARYEYQMVFVESYRYDYVTASASIVGPVIALRGRPITFACASTDPDGPIVSREWSVSPATGQTSSLNGGNGEIRFSTAGTYTITLVTTNSNGVTMTDTHQVNVRDWMLSLGR